MTELICIVCPRGCHLTVDGDNVTGNSCPRGKVYGINETHHPTRVVTSTVKLENADIARLPVKTSVAIPKDRIFDVMKEIHAVTVSAPVMMNQVIIPHVLGLEADIIATRAVEISGSAEVRHAG